MVLAKPKSRSLHSPRKWDCTKYTYDAASNRRMEINGTARTTYTCDAANQLQWTQDATGRTTYTFDNAGNQTLSQSPANVRVTQIWDIENRMTRVLQDTARSTYLYNGENLRVRAEESTGTSKFIWDGQIYLAETNSANVTEAVYTSEPSQYGYLLSQRRATSSFYHADELRSVTAITDSASVVTDTYLFNAFGVNVTASGVTKNQFRFVGVLGCYTDTMALYARTGWLSVTLSRWQSQQFVWPMHSSVVNYYTYNGIDYLVDQSVNRVNLHFLKELKIKVIVDWTTKNTPCHNDNSLYAALIFELSDKPGEEGYIVQKVTRECYKLKCPCECMVESAKSRQKGSYWEAFKIGAKDKSPKPNSAKVSDVWGAGVEVGFCGTKVMTGEMKFYTTREVGNLDIKWAKEKDATFACGSTSGGLPATSTKPSFWNDDDGVTITGKMIAIYSCCGEKNDYAKATMEF